MQPSLPAGGRPSRGRLPELLCLLWLAGMAMRITVLAVPPVLPLIRDDLGMTETEVGLLIGLPLVAWAVAAVPGSLLIARWGATLTLTAGLVVTALAAASRGAAPNVWLLYLATTVMGFGIAIVQPAVPTLVRDWLPHRVGLGIAVATNGMLVGIAAGPTLTILLVLPLAGQSWRLDLVVWAAPVLVAALVFIALAPHSQILQAPLPQTLGPTSTGGAHNDGRRWWPEWHNPLIWLLGLTFGSNNAVYYGVNAFLPDYLASIGRADLIGSALGWMNGSQLIASTLLLVTAEHVQRRTWPYLVFGPAPLAGVIGILWADGIGIVVAAALTGFSLAVTFVVTLALPPVLSPPGDVHRISAGMFTVSFAFAVVVPVVCGAMWDLTGRPWAAFAPVAACAVALTMLGVALSRHRPAAKTS
jgi:MFS transporter, CP family, cyanate transporter